MLMGVVQNVRSEKEVKRSKYDMNSKENVIQVY